jgi:hypothetical protein
MWFQLRVGNKEMGILAVLLLLLVALPALGDARTDILYIGDVNEVVNERLEL